MSQRVGGFNVNPFRSGSLERDTWDEILTSTDFSAEFLKADTVTSAILTVIAARQEAGLTQSQVAERMETSQSAIARLEKDLDGSMSLARFVDWAYACGLVTQRLAFVSSGAVQTQALDRLQSPIWSRESDRTYVAESLATGYSIAPATSAAPETLLHLQQGQAA